jgi:putative tryptophan/tyrosine transport system substrate-binding protein
MFDLRRREFVTLLGGAAAAWPLAARAQQPAMPVIAYLGLAPASSAVGRVKGLRSGLRELGYAEGSNLVIEFRWAESPARLPELATELVKREVAVIVTSGNAATRAEAAAHAIGQRIVVLDASTVAEIEKAFVALVQQQADALLVNADILFTAQRELLVALAARHHLPASYAWREFAEAGGLMSYGTNLSHGYHQMGIYAGRILKGEKPSDLPVMQPTKFELVINLKTAKALGVQVPDKLIALSDEVIE